LIEEEEVKVDWVKVGVYKYAFWKTFSETYSEWKIFSKNCCALKNVFQIILMGAKM
jgi:hypothetical protein